MRTTIQAVALSVIAMTVGDALATHRQTPFELEIPFQVASDDPSIPPQALGIQTFRPFSQGESARWIAFDSTVATCWATGAAAARFSSSTTSRRARTARSPTAHPGTAPHRRQHQPGNTSNGKTVVFESTSNLAAPPSTRCTQPLPATADLPRASSTRGRGDSMS